LIHQEEDDRGGRYYDFHTVYLSYVSACS
jgi:hypothetical protein